MRGESIFRTNWRPLSRRLTQLLAVLAIALHVFTVQGHVHPMQFGQGATGHAFFGDTHQTGGAAHDARQSLSNTATQAPCVFCQTMAATGPGLLPLASLLVLSGAAALVAALFGQRQAALQRLTIWRSRAPPSRL